MDPDCAVSYTPGLRERMIYLRHRQPGLKHLKRVRHCELYVVVEGAGDFNRGAQEIGRLMDASDVVRGDKAKLLVQRALTFSTFASQ